MGKILDQTIRLSGILNIPNSMPECLRIIETNAIPSLKRGVVKENGIIIQGALENTIDYCYVCPTEHIEKSIKLKYQINFARFIEIENLQAYSAINLKVNQEWQEFKLVKPRQIRFFQIVSVYPICATKSHD